MNAKKTVKILFGGAAAVTMCLSLSLTAGAMPSDVRGGTEYNREMEEGELIDDSAFLESVGTYYVASGAGNVRSYPNGPIIDVLTPGQRYYVPARRTDCNWYQIAGYGTNAYAYITFLVPEEEYSKNGASDPGQAENSEEAFTKLDIMMQATADVNMRRQPNGTVVDVLKEGTDIHVVGNMDDISWYKCEYQGKTVYVCDDYLVPDFPQTMAATHNVNVRQAPGTDSAVVGSLKVGDRVKVSAVENGWLRFTFDKAGDIGYSYSDYLAAVQ